VISSRSCSICEQLKGALKTEIESGEIKVFEVEDEETTPALKRILDELDIKGVPTVFSVKDNGNGRKVFCEVVAEDQVGECREVDGVELE